MSGGNTSNTSNARPRTRKLREAGALVMAIFEAVVLVEIVWYYLHDEEQTLHAAISEWLRERAERRAQVDSTLDMIRELPERE